MANIRFNRRKAGATLKRNGYAAAKEPKPRVDKHSWKKAAALAVLA